MIFLVFLLWRYRVVCSVHLGKVFLARSTISSNKLPAYLQLYFQSYESLNVAVISQMATPLSMHIDFCQHEGIKDRLSCTSCLMLRFVRHNLTGSSTDRDQDANIR